jgi:hypothetical protein
MGKFKTFIENQTIGLGDLGRKINHLYHSQDFGRQIAGAYASSDVTGSEQSDIQSSPEHQLNIPDADLTIPSTTRSGVITTLELKESPIKIYLSDGTKLNFTWDEYKKIQGEPAMGKTMTVVFQRHPEDMVNGNSKINKVIVS